MDVWVGIRLVNEFVFVSRVAPVFVVSLLMHDTGSSDSAACSSAGVAVRSLMMQA